MNPCHLCGQIEGQPAHDLIASLLPASAYTRRIVLEDQRFAVLPSLGALQPDHLLICPRVHVRSVAALAAPDLAALQQMVGRVDALLRRPGCELLLFEHGMAATGHRVPCTVDHAHLHAVPVPAGLADGLLPALPWQAVAGGLQDVPQAVAGAEYLMRWRLGRPLQVALAPPEGHPSQAMRRALAEHLQPAPVWNWRDAPRPELAHATWARLTSG